MFSRVHLLLLCGALASCVVDETSLFFVENRCDSDIIVRLDSFEETVLEDDYIVRIVPGSAANLGQDIRNPPSVFVQVSGASSETDFGPPVEVLASEFVALPDEGELLIVIDGDLCPS